MAPNRLSGLDGLRAISILLVLINHSRGSPGFPGWSWLRAVADEGGVGVTIFFGLSGYLITWILVSDEAVTGRIHLGKFYWRRAVRILPPVFLYLGCLWLGRSFGVLKVQTLDLVACAGFFRQHIDMWQDQGATLTFHFWSLSVEEQFYLVWPLLLILTPKTFRLPLTLSLVLFAPIWRQLNIWMFTAAATNRLRMDFLYDNLLWGALLALIATNQHGANLLKRWARFKWIVAVLVVAGTCFALYFRYHRPMALQLACPTVLAFAIACGLWLLVNRHFPVLNRVLDWSPLQWLGRISYSLYIWHVLFLAYVFEWKSPYSHSVGKDAWFLSLPWCWLLALACAAVSYYGVERPCLRWRDRHPPHGGEGTELPAVTQPAGR